MSNSTNQTNIGPTTDKSINSAKSRLLACAKSGLFRHAISIQYGGLGNSFMDLSEQHSKLGYESQDPGLVLAVNAHVWGSLFTIYRFGTEAQKNQWLPPLVSGEIIGGHAITEPHAGSDARAISSTYRTTDSGYILNGCKRYITNTPIAGMITVYARSEDTSHLSAFIVLSGDPGVKFEDSPVVTGCDTASMGDIVLQNCTIPADRLLGNAGAGANMIQLALELERAFIFSGVSGVMKWQLEQAVKYARQRESGEGILGQHQAISHKIADMSLRLDTTELWIYRCARLLNDNKRITVPSAQTKLYASEAFLQSSLDFVHILGAYGLNNTFTALVNDAMAGKLMAGSSEVQKNIIAAMLGLPMDNVVYPPTNR